MLLGVYLAPVRMPRVTGVNSYCAHCIHDRALELKLRNQPGRPANSSNLTHRNPAGRIEDTIYEWSSETIATQPCFMFRVQLGPDFEARKSVAYTAFPIELHSAKLYGAILN